jgi:hypothetical protein
MRSYIDTFIRVHLRRLLRNGGIAAAGAFLSAMTLWSTETDFGALDAAVGLVVAGIVDFGLSALETWRKQDTP